MDRIRTHHQDNTSFSMAEAQRRFVRNPVVQWTTLTIGSFGAIAGGILAQRNQDPYPSLSQQQIEDSRPHVMARAYCTDEKNPASIDPDPGMHINVAIQTEGLDPKKALVLTVRNPTSGETVTAGYYTPEHPIPSNIVLNNHAVDVDPKNLEKPIIFKPDMSLSVELQESLPGDIYVKTEDLTITDDDGSVTEVMSIPTSGDIITKLSINTPQSCTNPI